MLTLRHRTASGRLDSLWELDPVRRVLELVFRLGSAEPRAVTVPVCAPDNPRLWSHPVMRLDGGSWRLLSAIFVIANTSIPGHPPTLAVRDCCAPGAGLLGAIPCGLHEAIGREHVALVNAPADVDRELEELCFNFNG